MTTTANVPASFAQPLAADQLATPMPSYVKNAMERGGEAGRGIKVFLDADGVWRTSQHKHYLLPTPNEDGTHDDLGRGWTRVTTFAESYADKQGLTDWRVNNCMKGMLLDPTLVADVQRTPLDGSVESKRKFRDYSERALSLAGGRQSANLGSLLHDINAKVDKGELPLSEVPALWRNHIMARRACLARHGVRQVPELVERIVWIPDFGGLVGTFDRLVQHGGRWRVLDDKTGSLDYAKDSIGNQLGLYSLARWMWNPSTLAFEPLPEIDRNTALVLHLPAKGEPGDVELHEVNIKDSREHGLPLCAAVRRRQSREQASRLFTTLDKAELPGLWEAGILAARTETELREVWHTITETGAATAELAGLATTRRHELAQGAPVVTGVPGDVFARIGTPDEQSDSHDNAMTVEAERVPREHFAAAAEARDAEDRADAHATPTARRIADGLAKDGSPLAPQAGPGQRGCSACGRTGHRKGSPKCWGDDDPEKRPAKVVEVQTATGPHGETWTADASDPGAKDCPHAGAFTRDAVTGYMVCAHCGEETEAARRAREAQQGFSAAEAQQVLDQASEAAELIDHPFTDSYSGMLCGAMVMRDGGGDECGEVPERHRDVVERRALAQAHEAHQDAAEADGNVPGVAADLPDPAEIAASIVVTTEDAFTRLADATRRAATGRQSVGDEAILSADVAQVISVWDSSLAQLAAESHHSDQARAEFNETAAEQPIAEAAAERLAGIVAAVRRCTTKAELRVIRDKCVERGVWSAKLTQLGTYLIETGAIK